MESESVPILRKVKNIQVNEGEGKVEVEVEYSKVSLFTDWAFCIFNAANAAIGSGVLTLPYAFSNTGIVAGVVLTLVLVTIAFGSLHSLMYYSSQYKINSYQELIHVNLGYVGKFINEVIMIFYMTGANIVYLAVIADCVLPALQHYFGVEIWTGRPFVIITLGIGLVLPLTLLKNVNKLGFTSFLAVLGCVYMVGFVVVKGIVKVATEGVDDDLAIFIDRRVYGSTVPRFFLAFPIISFAYQSHVLTIPIYAQSKKPSILKMDTVIFSSFLICTVLYISTGIFGYLTFGKHTDGDILLNYDPDDVFANVGRLSMGLTSVFSYPMSNYTARLTINSLFFENRSIGAVTLMFIYPGLLMFKHGIQNKKLGSRKVLSIGFGIFYTVFGVIMGLCGLSVNILKNIIGGE